MGSSSFSTEGTSTYAFQLAVSTFERSEATPGSILEGEIPTAGSTDTFSVELTEGTVISPLRLGFNGECRIGSGPGFEWTVTDPSGRVIVSRPQLTPNCEFEDANLGFEATVGGTYEIAISGTGIFEVDKTGTYQIELRTST